MCSCSHLNEKRELYSILFRFGLIPVLSLPRVGWNQFCFCTRVGLNPVFSCARVGLNPVLFLCQRWVKASFVHQRCVQSTLAPYQVWVKPSFVSSFSGLAKTHCDSSRVRWNRGFLLFLLYSVFPGLNGMQLCLGFLFFLPYSCMNPNAIVHSFPGWVKISCFLCKVEFLFKVGWTLAVFLSRLGQTLFCSLPPMQVWVKTGFYMYSCSGFAKSSCIMFPSWAKPIVFFILSQVGGESQACFLPRAEWGLLSPGLWNPFLSGRLDQLEVGPLDRSPVSWTAPGKHKYIGIQYTVLYCMYMYSI